MLRRRQTLERDQQLNEIQKELEVARRIQLSILPGAVSGFGQFPGVAARYVPMTSVWRETSTTSL